MISVEYRELVAEDCERMKDMDASHYIKKAWREVDGKRRLIDINYQDPDWANGYEQHYNHLRETIVTAGAAIGAFNSEDKLVGFATVNREQFGTKYRYVLLDQLFITLEHRNKGIGKKLFLMIADTVKAWNVDKLYICSNSSEETVALYHGLGCIEAIEINQKLYECDPRDFQLEFKL